MAEKIFFSDCVGWPVDVDYLHELVDGASDISAEEFRQEIGAAAYDDLEQSLGYDPGGELRLASDYAVSFKSGLLAGEPAVFLTHSAIEFVFVSREHPFFH